MKSARILIGAACAACFVAACSTAVLAAAGPSTRPATTKPAASKPAAAKPAAKPAPKLDKSNSTEYASQQAKVKFRIPRAWKKLDVTSSCVDLLMFDVSPASESAGKGRSDRPTKPIVRNFSVFFGEPCDEQKKLHTLVESNRVAMRQADPNLEFIVDEPADFAGRSGWTLTWTAEMQVTHVETRNGKQTERTEKVPYLKSMNYFYENGFICQIALDSNPADVELMKRHCASVVATLEPIKE